MSETSKRRSEDFLQISAQFKLGGLVTEASHPVTANLSDVARKDTAAGLGLLFQADEDVLTKFRELARSGRLEAMARRCGCRQGWGAYFLLTSCGSTGRLGILLDSVWRDFWRQHGYRTRKTGLFSVMAGGDYALIKSVEGFEDFTAFGKKADQRSESLGQGCGLCHHRRRGDSFVIGTAWAGVEAGAKVYFVYNNPDEILCQQVERSREVIQDARIERLNLTTGPMAILDLPGCRRPPSSFV